MALPPFPAPFDLAGAGATPAGLALPDAPLAVLPAQPALGFAEPEETPADRSAVQKLRPGSDAHNKVMQKLTAMLKFSNDHMSTNFSRFRNQELKVQAYLHTQDYDELIETINSSKGAELPEPIQVTVPYTYATLHAAATYIATVLLGRKPIFPMMGVRSTSADSARYMETVIQSQLDANQGMERLWQHIWDSLLYGVAPVKIGWEERRGKTMRMGPGGVRSFADELKYAGNVISAVDPYKFRPDPRVPLHECYRRGDFMFDLIETSATTLLDMEKQNQYKWVREALAKRKSQSTRRNYENSNRGTFGARGAIDPKSLDVPDFVEVAEGTVRLVPKDWGLGDEDTSELWRFVWLPDCQIISAQPHGAIHEHHPYAVGEPTSLGHDFMSMSQAEMISVFQDVLSWLVTSRMENVRASVANSYIVDPSRIEMNDMRSSAIGRIIRMKKSAMGLPVNDAIKQLNISDVTGGHFNDIQTIRLLADAATGVNDNLRGMQSNGGRRSATEARMSMQAGASRLSQLAMRLSGQSFAVMASQMVSNTQQWMPEEFWIEFTGDEGAESIKGDPNKLVGNFNYQISDGSLPLDKGALIDQWKEVMMAVAQDPELRQNWDINEIFRYVAVLGGAKNIETFKKQPMIAPPGVVPDGQPIGPQVPPMPAALAASFTG